MDWITVGVSIGCGLLMYAIGYYDGRDRGYERGRKDGSRSMSKIWLSALTNRPEILTEEEE